MEARTRSSLLITILCILAFAFPSLSASDDCGISIYWGQHWDEGSIREVCATGLYKYVNLAYLITFGSGQTPAFNFAGRCETESCSDDIDYCQSKGIKVLLSIGGAGGNYTLSSAKDAEDVAKFLYDNFLKGGNPHGLLGDVALDGIDFQIEAPGSPEHWDDLALAIANFSTTERKIYLSAAPECVDPYLEPAIATGVFDYVWVLFYDNPQCDYSGGITSLLESWKGWAASLPEGNQIFMGLPASPEAEATGFIDPQILIDEVLPVIKQSPNYAGINLWSYYQDKDTSYSQIISPHVCDDEPSCMCPCPCPGRGRGRGRIKMVTGKI